jgi:hypothetical protein
VDPKYAAEQWNEVRMASQRAYAALTTIKFNSDDYVTEDREQAIKNHQKLFDALWLAMSHSTAHEENAKSFPK